MEVFGHIVCGLLLTLGFASQTDAMNDTITSVAPPSNGTVRNMDDADDSDGEAVIIACVVIAVMIILAAIIAFILLRKKRLSQMMDTEKKMQIQMTSARNAGVYQDLTVSNNEKAPASPEHERLKSAEEV